MTSAAITGSFCDYKFVKTRGVLQIIVEISVEQQAQAFQALGYPMPGTEIPVAIARLTDETFLGRRRASETIPIPPDFKVEAALAPPDAKQQAMQKARTRAIMLCKDPAFQKWLGTDELMAARYVQTYCCEGESRSLIATDEKCYEAFLELEQEYRRCTG